MPPAPSQTDALAVAHVESDADWEAARAIRERVFIDEQACPPEEEWDDYDAPEARGTTCTHLLGWIDDTAIATARWHTTTTADGQQAAKLERFAVLPAWRAHGFGRALVAAAIADAEGAGYHRLVLHAQAHLASFYSTFGFEPEGDPFWEAGIEHVKMVRTRPAGT
jgi:predicted GNAT family N-acyltransferase